MSERILRFPVAPIGDIYLNEGPPEQRWVLYGKAVGDVVVPADKEVGLAINSKDVERALKHLPSMKTDDLHALTLSGGQIVDASLQPVFELRGLRLISTQISEAGLEKIKHLSSLVELNLAHTKISDKGMIYVGGLHKLEQLILFDTNISDKGLVYVEDLSALRVLSIRLTAVSGVGLQHLEGLERLEELDISHTQVDDQRLDTLRKLARLKKLYVEGTRLSYAGLLELGSILPGCEIYIRQDPNTGRGERFAPEE